MEIEIKQDGKMIGYLEITHKESNGFHSFYSYTYFNTSKREVLTDLIAVKYNTEVPLMVSKVFENINNSTKKEGE